MDAVAEFRAHALNPEHPTARGSLENGDIFFQHREACNKFYDELPAVVEITWTRLMLSLVQITNYSTTTEHLTLIV